MTKSKLQLLSPLFLKYQSEFEKNPRSRVFAPLAEAYRKLGMTDKAMEILSQGIRFHPTYVMGYLGLAFCYFDIKQFNLAYSTLRPLLETNRDNLRLQKLFADICLELGKREEALEALKYLLFINPRDKDVSSLVVTIEREIDERYQTSHKPIIIPEKDLSAEDVNDQNLALFNIEKLSTSSESEKNDFNDWMTVDLNSNEKKESSLNESKAKNSEIFENWKVKKIDEKEDHSRQEKLEKNQTNLKYC
jgi:tetratricopeptide (TPR) repeat protein